MLTSVEFGLFFVPTDCVAHFNVVEHDASFEASHFIAWQTLCLLRSWLILELSFGNLRQQGDLISATRCKVSVLEQSLMIV